MNILKFLLTVADDLTDAEFADCDTYLDVQMDEPSSYDEEKFLHSILIEGVVYNFEMNLEDC